MCCHLPSLLNMILAIWVWSHFAFCNSPWKKTTTEIYVNTGKPLRLRTRILCTCLQHKEMSWSDIWHGFPRCRQLNTQLTSQRVHVAVCTASKGGICQCFYRSARGKIMGPRFTGVSKFRTSDFFCDFCLTSMEESETLSEVKKPVFLARSFCFIIIATQLEWSYVCHTNIQKKKLRKQSWHYISHEPPPIKHHFYSLQQEVFDSLPPKSWKNLSLTSTGKSLPPLIVAIKLSASHTAWQITHKN